MSIVLTGINQQLEWWDFRGAAEPVHFNLDGDFNQPVTMLVSNDPAIVKDAASIKTIAFPSAATVSAADGPFRLPFGAALFGTFASSGAWGAGTKCTPRFASTKDANGRPYVPSIQQPEIPPR